MKKITFTLVMILAITVSHSAGAVARKWTEKNSGDLKTYFEVKADPVNDSALSNHLLLKEALEFHLNRVNNEIKMLPGQNGGATATGTIKTGILGLNVSSNPVGGAVFAATRTPVYGIDFYASRTDMYVDQIKLQVSVKASSSAPEENPATLIKTIIVNAAGNEQIFPVTSETFIREGNAYYVNLPSLGKLLNVMVPLTVSKKVIISFDTNPIDFERQVKVGVYSGAGIKAKDTNNITSYYTLSDTRSYTFKKYMAPVVPPKVGLGEFFKNYFHNVAAQVVYMFGK